MNIFAKQVKYPSWDELCNKVITAGSDKEVSGIVVTAIAKYTTSRDPQKLAELFEFASATLYFMATN